jgi:hypothetical protein
MKFQFHPEALAEYEAAANYYAERQRGLELRFIESVERAIQQVIEAPDSFSRIRGGYPTLSDQGFPLRATLHGRG